MKSVPMYDWEISLVSNERNIRTIVVNCKILRISDSKSKDGEIRSVR